MPVLLPAIVLGRMSPSIVWNEAENFPYADGNPYVGPEAVAQGVLARCVDEWHGFTVAIDEIIDAGDTVIALGRYLGTYIRERENRCAHSWSMYFASPMARWSSSSNMRTRSRSLVPWDRREALAGYGVP